MNEFNAVFIGLLIRIGIPIVFTGGLVYMLRHLDVHWQQDQKFETNQKSLQEYQSCSAAKSNHLCWQALRKNNGYLAQKCLTCEVFRAAPVPTYW